MRSLHGSKQTWLACALIYQTRGPHCTRPAATTESIASCSISWTIATKKKVPSFEMWQNSQWCEHKGKKTTREKIEEPSVFHSTDLQPDRTRRIEPGVKTRSVFSTKIQPIRVGIVECLFGCSMKLSVFGIFFVQETARWKRDVKDGRILGSNRLFTCHVWMQIASKNDGVGAVKFET